MHINKFATAIAMTFCTMCSLQAQNPIVQTCYTADPAPMVDGDRLYVYIDRDEGPDWYVMNEWRVYSTADMVNWTDHGACLPLSTFSWGGKDTAWASQCIRKGDKYYWYVCCDNKNGGGKAIGVAESDSPIGPFKDKLKKPLISGGWGYIDPSPFIDDDGTAYLVWGNPGCFIAKLSSTMLGYSKTWTVKGNHVRKEQDGIWEFIQDEASFGGPKDIPEGKKNSDYIDLYEEGPWLMKRDGIYYLMYAAGGVPEHISYSTSDSPTGPWTYRGQIMRQQDTNSFTNHAGICTFKGHNYFFYHTGWLPGGGGFTRSVAVEEFNYNADGTIPQIKATKAGVKPIGTLNPYQRQEAETIAMSSGLKSAEAKEKNEVTGETEKQIYITDIHSGDYIKVRNVEFGDSVASITVRVASNFGRGKIVICSASTGGTTYGTITVPDTGGDDVWQELTVELTKPEALSGVKDIYFRFLGSTTKNCFNFDWWRFNSTSYVDGINTPQATNGKDEFYTISGTKIAAPQRGINIVKHPDGTTTKIIKKM
ncbi:MAG: family 43 glycosylhydrolase [Prevotellaceae bacterium]|nr:family 43 glycosylhydrolase [Candidatus Minthosoma caballi]